MADTAEKLAKLSTEELFKTKSKAMALVLLDQCYDEVTSPALPSPFSQKIEFLKTVAKFGELEPKQAQLPTTNVGFSIRVIYGGDEKGVVIESESNFLDNVTLPENRPLWRTQTLASLVPPEQT